jgi:Tfp pilus assembly protein PilO
MMLRSSDKKSHRLKPFRTIIWLIVVCFILALGFIVMPSLNFAIRQYNNWTSGQKKSRYAKALINSRPKLEQENQELLSRNYFRLKSYDQDISQSRLLELLLDASKRSQISFVSVRPFPLKDQGKYCQLDFKLEIKAGYHQLGSFFNILEKSNSLIRFNSLNMTGDKSGSPSILAALNGRAIFVKSDIEERNLDKLLAKNKPEKGRKDSSFVYSAKYRDPFLPSGSTEAMVALKTGPVYRLKGIVWDAKNPLAVMMDEAGTTYFLRAGEKMGTDLLLLVKQNMVIFKRANGTRYELKINE